MVVRTWHSFSVLALAWVLSLCGLPAWRLAAQSSCSQQLVPTGGAQNFGRRVAIDGDTLLVDFTGAGFIYERRDGAWVQTARLPRTGFSGSAALSGGRVLLGGRRVPPVVWRREGDRWVREAVLRPGDALGPSYGQYYALGDEFAAVSDHDAGAVYFFRREGEEWVREQRVQRDSLFGWTIDLDGDVAVAGSLDGEPRRAIVLRRTETADGVSWEVEAELQASPELTEECGWFGADVAISGDVIVVGTAPDFAGGDNPPCPQARLPGRGDSRPLDVPRANSEFSIKGCNLSPPFRGMYTGKRRSSPRK